MDELTWVEISERNLRNNIAQFRKIIGPNRILCPCVKANAYGHGLSEASSVFLDAGADWLSVNALYEARALRKAGVVVPIYVMGYIPLDSLEEAVSLGCRIVAYNNETVEKLGAIGKACKIHLKLETGNNRQGLYIDELLQLAILARQFENIEIEGLASHFANIEDTTDHSYAEKQLILFNSGAEKLEKADFKIKYKHCANSAATMLFTETHFDLVRVGISSYGMWPSKETYATLKHNGLEIANLSPAFSWKTKIAQIKTVPAGETIGYGCTYKTGRETRIAVLPVGYYDGYDRLLSNKAYVLIHGQRAYVRGRVCMNIIMVDISDIPGAELEDEVVLLGRCGDEEISAELFASWADTINYEVTTRVNERIKRVVV